MGLGNLGDLGNLDLGQLQQLLPNVDFPATKDEVLSDLQSNDAPQEVLVQVGNAPTERFASADEVLQTLSGYEGLQHEEPPADEESRLREGVTEALAQLGLDQALIRQ